MCTDIWYFLRNKGGTHNIMDTLKQGLKRARKRYGLSQKELAKNLNLHTRTIQNWEQGIATPSLDMLLQLSDYYGCSLDYLTGRIDCTDHDIQYIHDQTGLSESAIQKLRALPTDQRGLFSRIIDHKDFRIAIKQVKDLSDKETIKSSYADMIVLHVTKELRDVKSTLPSNLIENALLFTLTNLISGIICDITETEL